MDYSNDERTVMTLDAGGTNFVFSAIQAENEIIEPVRLPAKADNLDQCLETIIQGFSLVEERIPGTAAAISFAFPGPADYPNGIIGDLGNLPAFRGGVALGPMLEEQFGLPVFINNDGDLFALGESVAGLLPEINQKLVEVSSPKRYHNLIGITLGTGFGCGIVNRNVLLRGDNSAGGEIWLMRSKLHNACFAEEDVSIRSVKRVFQEETGDTAVPEPREIYEIATGVRQGSKHAALKAFDALAESVGDALANTVTLADGLVVIGGGLAGAAPLFLNRIVDEMNGHIDTISGQPVPRLVSTVHNLDDAEDTSRFLHARTKEISVPRSAKRVIYNMEKKTGVGTSRLGTSRAVGIGAYVFALQHIDSQ